MPFDDGLETTIQWFRDHWTEIRRDAEFPPGMSAAAQGITAKPDEKLLVGGRVGEANIVLGFHKTAPHEVAPYPVDERLCEVRLVHGNPRRREWWLGRRPSVAQNAIAVRRRGHALPH